MWIKLSFSLFATLSLLLGFVKQVTAQEAHPFTQEVIQDSCAYCGLNIRDNLGFLVVIPVLIIIGSAIYAASRISGKRLTR